MRALSSDKLGVNRVKNGSGLAGGRTEASGSEGGDDEAGWWAQVGLGGLLECVWRGTLTVTGTN